MATLITLPKSPRHGDPRTNHQGRDGGRHPQQGGPGSPVIWLGLMVLLAVLILSEPLLLLFRG